MGKRERVTRIPGTGDAGAWIFVRVEGALCRVAGHVVFRTRATGDEACVLESAPTPDGRLDCANVLRVAANDFVFALCSRRIQHFAKSEISGNR
jgi:hypothetical protein